MWTSCRAPSWSASKHLVAVSALLLLAAASPGAGAPAEQAPRSAFAHPGIYAIAPRHAPFPGYVLPMPEVTGVSLREDWQHLEPNEQRFDWAFLDKEIGRARGADKLFTLRLYPGVRTPEWVYAAGAERFRYTSINPGLGREKTYGETLSFPVPWDPVAHAKWRALVTAVGRRYGQDRRLVMVHVMGPNAKAAEMFLPNQPADMVTWARVNYTPEKLVEAWKLTIDLYAAAFPHAMLSLNLGYPLIRKGDPVVDEVVQWAYQAHGSRLSLQNNSLRDPEKARLKRHDFEIIRRYAGEVTIGFQTYDIGSARLARGKQGDLQRSIDWALQVGACYLEVYPPDVRDARGIIRAAAQRLREGCR